MTYILTEEVLRLQKLAGIETKSQESSLEEILLEAYVGLYYLQNNLLLENLDEGVIDTLKSKIKKLNLKPTVGLVASMLRGLKDTLTEEGYQKIIQIIQDYDGPKNISQIADYINQNLNMLSEGIFDLFRNKKTGDANVLSKSILSTLTFIILFNLTSNTFFSQAQANTDKVPPTIENPEGAANSLNVSDSTQNILNQASEAADEIIGVDTGTTGANPVTTDNDGKTIKVGFDTGEFEISDKDEVAKKIADDIIKQAKDKKIKNVKLGIKGLISNTPGAGDDDPDGPGKSGLGEKRLEAGKDIVKKVNDIVKKTFPGSEISIEDEGTNVNDPGAEVEVDSKEAKDSQAVSFTILDIETEDKAAINTPDNPLTYFRRDKDLQPDGNKYYTILGYFLPLITNNKQPSKEFMEILNMKEGDVINDSFVNKKLSELPKQYPLDDPKSKEAGNVMRILSWAQKVKKNPKSIGEFFKSLDPKINIPWEKRVLTKPGEKGKAAFTGGSGATQTPAPSAQAQDRIQGAGATSGLRMAEIKLFNIYENLLLEATISTWKSLPDYDETAAKNNLGELVPLYVYTWDIGDGEALKYIAGINDDGSINKDNPYKSSWEKFDTKYPVLWKKATNDLKYSNSTEKNKSIKPKNITTNFDTKQSTTKNLPDTNKIIKAINNNATLKTSLNRIDTVQEFKELVLAMLLDLPFYKEKPVQLKTALNKIKARIQPRDKGKFSKVTEASKLPDVVKTQKIIDTYTQLQNILPQINSEEEIIQIIVRSIIPFLNPRIKDSNILQQAIVKAYSEFDKASKDSGEGEDVALKETLQRLIRERLRYN